MCSCLRSQSPTLLLDSREFDGLNHRRVHLRLAKGSVDFDGGRGRDTYQRTFVACKASAAPFLVSQLRPAHEKHVATAVGHLLRRGPQTLQCPTRTRTWRSLDRVEYSAGFGPVVTRPDSLPHPRVELPHPRDGPDARRLGRARYLGGTRRCNSPSSPRPGELDGASGRRPGGWVPAPTPLCCARRLLSATRW